MRLAIRMVAIVIALIAMAPNAHAGWVLTETNGDETLISKGWMRSGWENGAMLFDGHTKQVHFIDERRKIMSSGTVDEICSGMEQMVASMLESIPAEQREMMKKMMAGSEQKVEIIDKGEGEKIAGFKTKEYHVMAGGELYEKVWLSQDKALLEECQALTQMLGKFMSCMSGLSEMGGSSPESSPEYAKLFEMGIIVKSIGHDDDGNEQKPMVIAARDVPQSVFDLPKGYKSVPLSAIWGMGGE